MSRDPSQELELYKDWLYAKAERDSPDDAREQQPAPNWDRSTDQARPVETAPTLPTPDLRLAGSRGVLYDRERGYRLRASEIHTLTELGKFRAVGVEDLARHAYAGHRDEMDDDVRNLVRQGLLRKGTFEGPEGTPRELLTLSKAGYRLLRANRIVPRDQALHHGFVKPREANHNADLYLLYQKEAARITAQGGRLLRVVLDFELKKKINHDFAKFGTEARQEIAGRHGLQVVRGKIPVPDMRIEYEKPGGEIARIDLELVTEHYRGGHVADKVRAGFSLYTPRGEADRLRRVLDQRELTAEILSL
jgi:hypothetical protein